MLQVEHHLVHRHVPLEDHPARRGQDKARHQTEHQMAIRGILTVDLARVSGQQMREGAEDLFNQMTTRPEPQQARRWYLGSEA